MNKGDKTFWILAAALLAWFFWPRKRDQKIDIGNVSSEFTTAKSFSDLFTSVKARLTASEPVPITQIRAYSFSNGIKVDDCSLNGICTTSNGWSLPKWLLIDSIGLKEPAAS